MLRASDASKRKGPRGRNLAGLAMLPSAIARSSALRPGSPACFCGYQTRPLLLQRRPLWRTQLRIARKHVARTSSCRYSASVALACERARVVAAMPGHSFCVPVAGRHCPGASTTGKPCRRELHRTIARCSAGKSRGQVSCGVASLPPGLRDRSTVPACPFGSIKLRVFRGTCQPLQVVVNPATSLPRVDFCQNNQAQPGPKMQRAPGANPGPLASRGAVYRLGKRARSA